MSIFKVGDSVRVKAGRSGASKRLKGQVVTVTSAEDNWVLVGEGNDVWDSELELITKGGAQMARKTYKLIKDTPTVKTGAIYQEACDDGTQEYLLLDQAFIKDKDGSGQAPIHTRSLVEEAPKWFVQVFAVEPQYMTREELDQWEAFQSTKSKKTKTVALKATPAPKTSIKAGWTPARRKAQSARIKAAWAAKKAKAL